MGDSKFYKTRLCQSFQRGRCYRHNCNFAHGNAELRRFSENSHGRRENRVGDLREKLLRKYSPRQRHSPKRDHGNDHGPDCSDSFREASPTRERKRRKKELVDGGSDFSGSLRTSDGAQNREKHTSVDSEVALEEQVNGLQSDIKMLNHRKVQLGICLEEKVQEADSLVSMIKELEAQLEKEKKDCERITSKIKKFVKAHDHYSKLQDELKRSQLRLHKLGEQLTSVTSRSNGGEEDSRINILGDVDANRYPSESLLNERENHPSPIKEILHVNGNFASSPDGEGSRRYPHESIEEHSQWSSRSRLVTNENLDKVARSNGEKPRNEKSCKSAKDKQSKRSILELALPATGMAAHAGDERPEIEEDKAVVVEDVSRETRKRNTDDEVDGLHISLPPPLPLPCKSYSQHERDDEIANAEVMEMEETLKGTQVV
ncbi:zinc finger CCCH domain-containing protein 13-like [Rutidosis leptorrhynchoides]|uniref:zinc finger CCCH domain-containing protein 13-like n=1 Tax=Rutidosis leptorrhynchoides TaxID=125765 RepID=UPI003A98F3C4